MAKKVLKVVLCVIGVIVLAIVLLFGVLTIIEFRPDDVETLTVSGNVPHAIEPYGTHKILSWNIGYGALGDNADFFLDGGKGVKTADKKRVTENLSGIVFEINSLDPDIIMMQEADIKSGRSSRINEHEYIIGNTFGNHESDSESTFAYNFKALVPYPVPPIGIVRGGISTASRYQINSAERIQLPCPFKWPVRLGNLKRCLSINRMPISGSYRELVVVNLHLEAYDSGEGKIAQTKMLREYLEKEVEAGNYVIAGGDFNQTFSDVDISAYPVYDGMWKAGVIDVNDFSDNFNLYMDNENPSCRSLDKPYAGADKDNFQYYIIDGFIVSKNVNVLSVKTQDLSFVSSDHNPVLMEFELTEE
ncbi:MAG: endonuclease [Lachnospiraceae bacterium]|nr:endonuclease [Lachnospiraceae bacterium]